MNTQCEHIQGLLSEYLDGLLTPGEAERVAEHVRTCPQCRQQLEKEKHLLDLLGRLPVTPAPPELLPNIMRELSPSQTAPSRTARIVTLPRLAAISAAAAALLILSIGIHLLKERPDFRKDAGTSSITAKSGPASAPVERVAGGIVPGENVPGAAGREKQQDDEDLSLSPGDVRSIGEPVDVMDKAGDVFYDSISLSREHTRGNELKKAKAVVILNDDESKGEIVNGVVSSSDKKRDISEAEYASTELPASHEPPAFAATPISATQSWAGENAVAPAQPETKLQTVTPYEAPSRSRAAAMPDAALKTEIPARSVAPVPSASSALAGASARAASQPAAPASRPEYAAGRIPTTADTPERFEMRAEDRPTTPEMHLLFFGTFIPSPTPENDNPIPAVPAEESTP